MALNRADGSCSPAMVKVALGMLGLCLAGYILGPPLYWHFMEGLAALSRSSSSSSCPPCLCDCSSQPLLSIPQGLTSDKQVLTLTILVCSVQAYCFYGDLPFP